MADVRAFRAFRYDLGRVGTLSDVIAPPYDVIDATLQQTLYDRSPYNVIRLILNKEEAADNEQHNRYTRAANVLRDWQANDVLVQDSARSLYVYQQEFEVEGQRYTRKGVLARVRLEKLGEGRIYAHEQTLAGPKADRLKLFHATNMNLSPVFGLFPDREGSVQEALDRATGRSLPLEATDHLGVTSRLWPISDQHAISSVAGLMGPKPIFIADGHHRYETGLRYFEEQKAAGNVTGDDHPAGFILMMLVSMSDPGLIIMPTHRLVSGLPAITSAELRSILGDQFTVDTIGKSAGDAKSTWEMMQADGGQNLLGLCTVADGNWHLARLKSPSLMAQLAADHTEQWRGLAVSILHVLVLDHLFLQRSQGTPTCRYVHLLSEVTDAVAKQECQLAVLVPPATMDHVEQIAGNLEKMPPKSTYFYPKLLSGLVFNSLKVN